MNHLLQCFRGKLVPASGALGFLTLVLSLVSLPLSRPVVLAAEEEGKKEQAKKDDEKKDGEGKEGETKPPADPSAPKPTIDDDYVKENLEKHLHPTKVEFQKDGRVKLIFDLREKKEDHMEIFTPKVGAGYQSPFRWSLSDEEHWSAADGNDVGLRISNTGSALLNCWFLDDVEAEMTFLNRVTFNQRMYTALFFSNDKGSGIGSNLGSQCAKFANGKPAGAKGNLEAVVNDAATKIKLVVRNGTFEAFRNGRSRQNMTYTRKTFSSGRLGFAWGGNIMGFVSQLEIVGKIDSKRMVKVMQKAPRG